jgi:hypothetical protein
VPRGSRASRPLPQRCLSDGLFEGTYVKQADVLEWVRRERKRQDRIYPGQRLTPRSGATILAHEVADVFLELDRPGREDWREYRDQVLHVAAFAVRILEGLDVTDEPDCLMWG